MPEKNSNTRNLGASLAALRDSLKPVHPADIHSGVKALTRFMAEQMVIDNPVYDNASFTANPVSSEYPGILEAGRGILMWSQQVESGFAFDLADYVKLASAVHGWIFFLREISADFAPEIPSELMINCCDEISRIGDNLGFEVFGFDSHRGVQPIHLDPLSSYLHETDVEEIIRRKVALKSIEQSKLPLSRNAGNRAALYDKCVTLSARLQNIYIYATSHLTIAVQASRDILLECGDVAPVREQKAAKQLWGNLKESLLVAERTFRQ